MDAEQIVRALAAADPTTIDDDRRWTRCGLCARQGRIANSRDPRHHDPACPWRLAVEWVAAHDRFEANLAASRAVADEALRHLTGVPITSPVVAADLLTCPACREYEPAPTSQEIDGCPEIIARPCSSCGADLWWNAGVWRKL